MCFSSCKCQKYFSTNWRQSWKRSIKWRRRESVLFRFRAFALIVHQIQLLLASSAVVRPDTNRKLQQELHFTNTRAQKLQACFPFSPLVVTLCVKVLYRAAFDLKKKKKNIKKDRKEIQRRDILSEHRNMSCEKVELWQEQNIQFRL